MRHLLPILPLLIAPLAASSTDHLISYWDLEDNTSDTASAGSTTDNGTWVGSSSYNTGKFGRAMETGGNSYISVPDSADLKGTGNTITVSAWFRVVSFDTGWQALLAKGENSNWRLARRAGTSEMAYAGGSGDITGGAVNDGGWHHIVGISENGVGTRIYVDGVLEETGGAPNINDSGNPLFIGNNPDNSGRTWNGLIDDIGIFDTALNNDQAIAIHTLGQNATFTYSLDQINELFQLGECSTGTTITIGANSWESVASDPADGRAFVKLDASGSGVAGSSGPVITSFTADHTTVPPGMPITVTWNADPTADLYILAPGVGPITPNGQGTHTFNPGPTADVTYQFSAIKNGASNTRAIEITVTNQPIIEHFTATPNVLSPGQNVTIDWSTLNTTSVTLDGNPVATSDTLTLTPSSTTSYTLTTTNANGTTTETITVPVIIPGEPVISEFMAANETVLLDEDGDGSDWIQISNPTNANTVINNNYFLTDDPDDLQKWAIPNQTITPGDSIRYFATGKIGTALPHANFSLSSGGEYLALVKFTGGTPLILSEFNDYPRQYTDISYGILPDLATYQYFQTPTPDTINSGTTFLDFVRDTDFSVDRGFYNTTQTVAITSTTPSTDIYYTTDGSEPSTANGTLYTAPLSISSTTTLRAIGTKTQHISTNIDTHTYIFVDDIVTQPTNPTGWPTGSVNGQVMDYHMDPGSAVSSSTQGVKDALTAIPSMSIVTTQSNLTNSSNGIYVRPGNRGRAWERPASLELIYPPGYVSPDGQTDGFQIDFGVRIRGGASRSTGNPKHAFRMFFRKEYGGDLDYPLFGTEGTSDFSGVDLRTAQNYSWSFKGTGNLTANQDNSSKNTFLREVSGRDTQRALGEPYTRSRYIHLYLNGVYWGLFMTQERAEAEYAAEYFPGSSDEFDTVKSAGSSGGYGTEMTDGNNADWMAGYGLAISVDNQAATNNSAYFQLQGLNNSGVRDPALPVHFNVDNLIHYMMTVFYNGSFDAPLSTFIGASNNWFGVRNRERDDIGWSFFAHDMEHSLGSYPTASAQNDRTGPFWFGSAADQVGFNKSNPQYVHQYLANNNEYRMRWADLVHKEFFNGGVFTDAAYIARIEDREAIINTAIDAEAARWGDSKSSSNPLDRTEWALAVNQLKGYVNARDTTVLAQLINDDLYPSLDAPIYSQHGGQVSPGFNLTMTNPDGTGTIYYTTDGSDPRLVGGGISGTASSGNSVTLTSSTLVQARVRVSATNWSALTSANFATAGQPTTNQLVISEINYHPVDPTAAETAAGFIDDDDFEFIEILNTSGGPLDLTNLVIGNEVTYNFSTIADPNDRILAAGDRIVITRDLAAFTQRYPGITAYGDYAGSLSNNNGTVDLLLTDNTLIYSVSYDDNNGWPESADGDGYTLVLIDDTMPNDPASWRISADPNGNPGSSNTQPYTGPASGLLAAVLRDGAGNYIEPIGTVETYGATQHLTITLRRYLPVDNVDITIERSPSLELADWHEDLVELVSSTPEGDGSVTDVYRMTNPVTSDDKHFLRVKLTQN